MAPGPVRRLFYVSSNLRTASSSFLEEWGQGALGLWQRWGLADQYSRLCPRLGLCPYNLVTKDSHLCQEFLHTSLQPWLLITN